MKEKSDIVKLPNISAKFVKVFAVILLMTAFGGGYYYLHRGEVSTDDAAIDGRVVTLSPKVQGYVKEMYMEDNQVVKAGDVLLKIDPTDYLIRRDKAKAALLAAEAAARAGASQLQTTAVTAPSAVDAADAEVRAAEATWEKSLADLIRAQELYAAGAFSRQQLDQAVATEKKDRSASEKLRAELRSARTAPTVIESVKDTSDQLAAAVKQAEAELAQAEADLANTVVTAPMDGRVTKRGVEVGSYVQASQQLASLVGTEVWVTANFKETQLEDIRPGQLVDISVDAYPNLQLRGRVESLQAGTGGQFSLFPAENATGNFVKTVQRVPVKIVFETQPDGSAELSKGMSVIPTVHTRASGSNP